MNFLIEWLHVIVFASIIGLAAFLFADAKSHAKPRNFLIGAMVMILVAYVIQVLESKRIAPTSNANFANLNCTATQEAQQNIAPDSDSRERPTRLVALACHLDKAQNTHAGPPAPVLAHLTGIISLTCGAFAGALASAAITNRAKFQHDVENASLLAKLAKAIKEGKSLAADLGRCEHELSEAEKSAQPADIAIARARIEAATRQRAKNLHEQEELIEKLRKVDITG